MEKNLNLNKNLSKQIESMGIESPSLVYNPSFEQLRSIVLSNETPENERGTETTLGAVAIDTGRFVGRCPKDKYVTEGAESKHQVWWHNQGSDNKPISPQIWQQLRLLNLKQLGHKVLYVCDGFCGASENSRLKVRLVTEVAWMAHFFKNMFIRPTAQQLSAFEPDWTILNACKTQANEYQQLGLNSSTYVAFNFEEGMTLIGGTWYGGEIKKGIFSVMNYFLPQQNIGSFHCSANQGVDGSTALFFGLSGTGKTTLSTDSSRALIGDDEHGWDDEGIFNFEGGCYAKTIFLSQDDEPEIYQAIRRDALLENVVVSPDGIVDFNSSLKTENTRVSYPIDHIANIVKPFSKGQHPDDIIFLTCDAYGILPPVSKLNKGQALYHFLSGYTAKIPGTELGVTQPIACFSACFGKPFLMRHPAEYAKILSKKIEQHGVNVFLVNTGWIGGPYGIGYRISIRNTRKIIALILDGSINRTDFALMPVFNLEYPVQLPGINADLLNPIKSWEDPAEYIQNSNFLAERFMVNFEKFSAHPLAQSLIEFGPILSRSLV